MEKENIVRDSDNTNKNDHQEVTSQIWRQEAAPWMPFDDKIDKDEKRISPTETEAEKMDMSLDALADLFEGSDVRWQLDGALNISLMNGEYIGVHKDVDLSVEVADVEKLEELLVKKGYGLFVSEREGDKRVLRRVGHAAFVKSPEHVLVEAVDEQGNIIADVPLQGMDIHLVRRDENGNPLNENGASLPKEWYEPVNIVHNGKNIKASSAEKVLYFKMRSWRNYDKTDLDRLAETRELTEDGLNQVAGILERDFSESRNTGLKLFEKLTERLSTQMSAEEFLAAMKEDARLKQSIEFQGKESFLAFAGKVLESGNLSSENLVNIAIEHFGIEKMDERKRVKIASLRRIINDNKKLDGVRKKIEDKSVKN